MDETKRQDPRYIRSYEALAAAVCELAATRPVPEISVTMLTERAGVSRPTFYQHVADVRELVRDVALRRLGAATPKLPILDLNRGSDVPAASAELAAAILQPLQHLARHQHFYLNVLDHAGTPDLFARVIALLAERMDTRAFAPVATDSGIPADRFATVVHGGIMWSIVSWLHGRPTIDAAAAMASEVGTIFSTLLAGPRQKA